MKCELVDGNTVVVYDSKGRTFLISPCDIELIERYTWHINSKGYVRRHGGKENGKWVKSYLHRDILKPSEAEQVDHVNGNKADNRRTNLRLCSNMQNQYNRPVRRHNTSGATGVWFRKITGNWVAEIKADGKKKTIGEFKNKSDAIQAREAAEILYFKEFKYRKDAVAI